MTLRTITFDDAEWQVVPQELTGSMIDTINGHIDADSDAVALWRDALIDAPEPPAQQPHDPEEPSAINFDIRPGSQWTHRNGNRYTVVATANEHSTDPERYPITVVYLGTNGRLWSRRADDWHRSMTPEPPAQPRRPYGTDTMSEYGVIPECDGSEPPAQQQDEQLPPYSAWMHVIDEAMVVRHLGVADPDDDYVTAQRKLNMLMDWEIDVATDPAVGGDRVRKQQPMTDEQIVATARSLGWATEYGGLGEDAIALSRAVERIYGIGKEEPK